MGALLQGLMVTVIGMGVVFITLAALSLILDLFRVLSEGSSTKKVEPELKQETAVIEEEQQDNTNEEDELELVAVITAAIAASLGTSTDQLTVRSFRRVQSKSSWNTFN